MIISQEIFLAIMSVLGIGVIGIVQTLKNLLKLDGWKALVLTGLVSFAATAFYFVQVSSFTLVNLLVYGAIVFGEASGLYKVFNK